ncbi:MAG: minichromosome maintenance protein MCM [Thermoplasmata archaeon]
MSTVRRAVPMPPELTGRWTAVFEEGGFRPRLLEIADRFPEERSLEVPFGILDSIDTPLADLLLERPTEVLAAGTQAMRELLPIAGPEADGFRLRITGLPPTAHRSIRSIRETDLNRFVAIDGIVRKVTEVRPQIREAVFQCAVCSTEFIEVQEEGSLALREPIECPEAQGGCGKPAGRTRFRLLPERSTYVDSQRIEIQESPETLRGGAHPQGVPVFFTEDLTGRVIPGNRIVANGILKSLQRTLPGRSGSGRATTFDLSILANSIESKQVDYAEIEITEEEERFFQSFRGDPTIVDKIVLSLAPTIKGMEQEKEAIALQLFGGVEKHHEDGIRVRGDINVLLIGDPGVAKSQLLRYITDVAPRGIYTSGKGATAAGLTAAAVKDDFAGGRWVLEAGMLVLADGGMAIIDELDKMSAEDRSAMHEVLEQQTVSIAKAGITATLNARCPVLAAANPKWGRFDSTKSIAEQIDLPPTLLSRFDVIFSIMDRPEEKRDRFLASRILQAHRDGEARRSVGGPSSTGAPFSPERLKKYIAYARKTIRPVLTDGALTALEDYYVSVRKQGEEPNAPVPITARQLEALVRLSEAAARARLSPTVEPADAQRAIQIMENFLRRVSSSEGRIDIDLVTSGVSHSQRERMSMLTALLQRLQSGSSGTFRMEEAQAQAEQEGISPTQFQSLFHSLRSQGELVEVRPNSWQLIRFA